MVYRDAAIVVPLVLGQLDSSASLSPVHTPVCHLHSNICVRHNGKRFGRLWVKDVWTAAVAARQWAWCGWLLPRRMAGQGCCCVRGTGECAECCTQGEAGTGGRLRMQEDGGAQAKGRTQLGEGRVAGRGGRKEGEKREAESTHIRWPQPWGQLDSKE